MEPPTITLTSEITVRLVQQMGGDAMVVAAARVSTSGEEAAKWVAAPAEENYGLIRYLMKQRHGSPFEHSALTFFAHAPIFVFREWQRHRVGHCLAADTQITLGSWTKSRTIAEVYRNWYEGVPDSRPFRSGQGVAFDKQTGKWRVQAKRGGQTISLGRYADRDEALAVRQKWEEDHPTFRVRRLASCRGLKARVLNEETQFFTTGRMADVYESGVKELYAVRTNSGHELHASRDHRILTEDGWAAVSELRAGDRIAVVGKRSKFAERQIPPSLRSGIGVWTTMQRNRLIRETDRCYICGRQFPREQLILDHVIPVVADLLRALDVTNLQPACEECNRIKTNGEQKLARRANVAGSRYVKLAETPSRVREGMTYDIEMEGPWHNFVANKIVVHNSYNEESARYKRLEPVFWVPRRGRAMVAVEGYTAARPKFRPLERDDEYEAVIATMREQYRAAYTAYLRLNTVEGLGTSHPGIGKEVARAVLPVGIYSSCWVTMNPRALMHFLSLRTHDADAKYVSYPQAEIEEAARACERTFAVGWPLTYKAFNECGRVAP